MNRVKLSESASTHINMWVNCIVPLSESQFIVFDQQRNMFIFQKNLFPVTLEDKLKLSLRGSFCIGEEVQSAVFGSLRVMQGANLEDGENDEKGGINSKVKQKKKTYLGTKSVKQNEKMEDEGFEESKGQSQDEKQIVTRGSVIKEKQIEQINALEIDNPS